VRSRDAAVRPLLVVAVVVALAGIAAVPTAQARSHPGAEPISSVLAAAVASLAIPVDLVVTTTTVTTTTAPPPPPAAPPTTAAAPPTTRPPAPTPTTVAVVAAPAAAPAPAPAPPPAGVDLGCERRLFEQTNQARAAEGLPALAFSSGTHAVARGWAQEMASRGRMSHNPDLGRDLDAAGVPWQTAGENVGHGDVERIFTMWMGSATHRSNIVSASYTAAAVACVHDGTQMWVAQNFVG
jgi:uncharacterized protein YkwD